MVRYDCPPELCGTLERIWTFIQWTDGKQIYSQLVIEQGAEITNDIQTINVLNTPVIVLVGYLTEYKPNPIFASAWRLNNHTWESFNIFEPDMSSNDKWEFSLHENELIIEYKDRVELDVELNIGNDGFAVYNDTDESIKAEFILTGDQISLKDLR